MTKNIAVSIFSILLIGLFAMKVSSIQFGANGDRIYSRDACIEDLNRIANAIKNTHPAPFDYINENDFNHVLQSQILELNDQNTLRDFHWIARKLIATIGCGHTALNGQNEERKIPDSLHFPLDARFVGDQLFIAKHNATYPDLKAGAEILSINGQSSKSMLYSMMQRVSSDGLNDAFPRFYINREVDFFIESHFKVPTQYTLRVADNGTKVISAGVAHSSSAAHGIGNDSLLSFDIDHDHDVAIMTIRSFNYYRQNFKEFQSYVDKSMESLRQHKTNNLIIDIRGNGGGDPNCANHLMRYISNQPYQYFDKKNMGYPDLKKEILPFENAYQGETYMIIDGGCGSTSGHLASLVKYNKTATLVGQTSGATYKCHDNSANITLPNTQLNLHIARHTFQTTVEGMTMSEGVIPDLLISKPIEDWSNGSDSVLDSIYQIIKR